MSEFFEPLDDAEQPAVENLPLRSLHHGGYTIEGYSRAAVQSYWRIPELKIGFDLGGSPWAFMGLQTIFITHAHLDHMAALPVYVARRRMMKMDPPTIYLPAESVDDTWKMLKAWHKLDRGRMICDLVGVKPGDEIKLGREHLVTAFQTKHTVASVGFIVYDVRKKLKEEYQGLPGEKIRDLRLGGEEVTHEVRFPIVCYTGDTASDGLDNHPDVYKSKILITEMTFFRPEHRKDKIRKFGHMHLDDILDRQDKFENELIVVSHFSTRYGEEHVRRSLAKKIPASLSEKLQIWL